MTPFLCHTEGCKGYIRNAILLEVCELWMQSVTRMSSHVTDVHLDWAQEKEGCLSALRRSQLNHFCSCVQGARGEKYKYKQYDIPPELEERMQVE